MPLRLTSPLAHDPGLGSLEIERWRRARFRAVVFAILGFSAVVLLASLIYNAQHAAPILHGFTGSNWSDDPSVTSDP
jgi:hypothetical protein